MEIRRWHYYVIFNCVALKYLEAKTISLNDVITAESQRKEAFETSLPARSSASSSKRYSLIQRLKSSPLRIRNFLESGFLRDHTLLGENILSPLKYRKAYLIKSPLKPRKLKLIQKSRYKRKNQSTKRETHGNEKLKQKYIPLLKSLSLLFDNLLNTDSSESYEFKTKKYKRNRFYSEETFGDPRILQTDSGIAESESHEETVTFPPTVTTASSITTETPTTTEVTSTTANIVTTRDFSTFRHNKNLPVLLSRNTSSGRGDDHGVGERSGATLHGDFEGNITRHHRDHEHAAGCGENESCAEDDEENTHGATRDGARGSRLTRPIGTRNNTGLFSRENSTDTETNSKNETTNDNNRQNQFQTGRNETKSGRILQEPLRRLRGFIPKNFDENTKSVQSKEVREESVVNVTHDNTSYQRITVGGRPTAEENQKVRTGHETLNSLNFTTSQANAPKKKSPVMMIFDGYSIVKHKNGQNKFAEKSIHIHS